MSRFKWYPSRASAAAPPKSNAGDLLKLIASGTLNYGLGQTLPLIIGFLLIPVYTAVLTPEDYGIVEVCAALSGLLTVFMRFGVPGAVTRFYYEHAEGPELRDYVTSVGWFLRTNAVAVGLIALAAGYVFLPRVIPGLPFFPFVPLAILASVLATNSDLQRRLIQVRRQSSYSARLSLANSLVGIGLTIFLVLGLRWGASGMLVAQVVTGSIFLINAWNYLRPDLTGRFRPEIVRESVHYGAGIFTSHFMSAAGPLLTRAALASATSIGAVGLYSLATRVTSPLTIMSSAFSTAYTPEYFSARKAGTVNALRAVARAESSIWTLGVQGSLAAALLGPPAIVLLTPERFHGAAALVPILSFGFLGQVLYALMSPEIFYQRNKWLPPLVTGANLVVTVALTFLLVGPFGAKGVAIATITGSVIGGLVCGLIAARSAPVPHDWMSLARASAAAAAAMVVASFLPGSPTESLLYGAGLVVATALVLLAAGDPLMRRVLVEIQTRLFPRAQPVSR